MIAGVRVPKRGPAARWGYWKFCLKAGDFAKASAAVLIDPERHETRILLGAIEKPPVLLSDAAAILDGKFPLASIVTEAAAHLSYDSHALHVAALRRAIAMATASGEVAGMTSLTLRVNGTEVTQTGRAAHASRRFRAREPQPHRHAYRLRARRLRRLHDDRRWPARCARA